MATGSARVSIASSNEPEHGEFGEPNPKFVPRTNYQVPVDPEPQTPVTSGPVTGDYALKVQLNSADPIDAVLIEMRQLMIDKSADYAVDGNPLSNFFRTAEIMQAKGRKDFTALDSVEHLLAVKQARLEALTVNGRTEETKNETVRDTMIDDANYAVLKLAIYNLMQEHKGSAAI